MHPPLQKAIYCAQKIETEFLLVEGIQQIEFDTVMSIDVTAGNNPMRQQRVATMTCYECCKKDH